MIQLISREEIFYKSSLVDHYISHLQHWYSPDYNITDNLDQSPIPGEDPFDHLEPFHDEKEDLDDFAVLGYVEKNKHDYLTHRSNALILFFELIGIKQLYLLDDLKLDWVRFLFKSPEKLETMKRMVNQPAYSEAFILDIDDLLKILPLFNFSGRNNIPIIWFFSVGTQGPLAMFLCDDGNFHTSFLPKGREKITSASIAAGLKIGGLEICAM